jgi:hypothetical protein
MRGLDRRQHREPTLAVHLIDVCEARAAVFARDQISWRSGHAYGPGMEVRVLDTAKETVIGGVKDSCQPH